MNNTRLLLFTALASIAILIIVSCQKDTFFVGDDLTLRYEVDTLRFDTVFTTVGTITRSIKVYNDYDEKVNIESITLRNEGTKFRLNVQGFSNGPIEDIVIQPQDSIYIFVEATVDPDAPISVSPFIIEDAITIITTNPDTIYLEAYGQNANYIPSNVSNGQFNYVSCNLGEWTWDDPKPYVMYGSLFIDSCTLVLPPGCRVYVHGGIADNELGVYNDGLLIIGQQGQIQARGELGNPVTIRTDRLEPSFQDDAGQWGGILLASSRQNTFDYTTILHSIVGVRVDSSSNATLNNCEIGFNSANAILGVHSKIVANNCLFHSSNSHGINLVHGGEYDFQYCTVFNESSQTHAVNINNYKCLDQLCFNAIKNPVDATFRNCLLYGYNSDEVWLEDIDFEDNSDFNYFFDHCGLRIDELLDAQLFPNFFENCSNCLTLSSDDEVFIDIDSTNFRLDTMSLAIDKAKVISTLNIDIEGNSRGSNPDLGCYEFLQ